MGSWAKFAPPTIANGKVYVPTFDNAFNVYGLLTNVNAPPVVSLTSPAANAAVSSGVTLTATAADTDGTIAGVDFYANGTYIGSGTVSGGVYSFVWTNMASGGYSLTAVATDNGNANAASTAVPIFVFGTGGGLTGSQTTPVGTQNLSTLGTDDWAHWGLTLASSYNHKSGAGGTISNFSTVGGGSAIRYTNNPNGFTWTGGTPTPTATATTNAVFVAGLNQGFTFTAPADLKTRTLVVYAGVFNSGSKLVAHLSDNSAPDYVDTSLVVLSAAAKSGMYTLTYKAGSAGQTLTVTYTQVSGSAGNITLQGAALATIAKPTPTITWVTPADIVYGTQLGSGQLNATASVPGAFSYTPAAGVVLNAGNGQTLQVAFTPTDTSTYNSATASVSINVSKATPAISWPDPADIVFGTALGATQLSATTTPAGSFAYNPPATTLLGGGATQLLQVTFTPTDTGNYTTATASAHINVSKATPTITWANPASVLSGTVLGGTQLNASANVPGSFVYAPASGTVLAEGNGQTLTATFTPDDLADYTTGIKTVTIDVAPNTPPGNSVLVTPPVSGGAPPTTLTFGTILASGTTTVTGSVSGPDLPTGFQLGTPAIFIDVTTTAQFAGSVTLCFSYAGVSYGDTSHLRLLHYAGGAWVDVTTSVDQNLQIICGATSSLSPFAMAQVTPTAPVITWTNPGDITYPAPLGDTQLNATASVPGSFSYAPPSSTVLNPGAGQTLSVTFTPDDLSLYTTATSSVQINVAKATPTVNWANPADITLGTALGATQLNATASVPGTYAYTPPASTILGAGNGQALSVTFTPADGTRYTPVTTGVQINVLGAAPNVSGALTIVRGGFRLVAATGRFQQSVTVKNNGAPLNAPVSLALDGLSANAQLYQASGVTSCAAPSGSPYATVNVGADNVFGAGEQVTVVLEFVNPSKAGISYAPRVLAGPGCR